MEVLEDLLGRRDAAFEAVLPFARMLDPLVWPSVERLNELFEPYLRTADSALRFEAQPPKRRRRRSAHSVERYETRVAERLVIPTRWGELHDVLNALSWAAFPRSKLAIARRQLELPWTAGRRAPSADALAMLDEGGIIFRASPADLRVVLEAQKREESDAMLARSRPYVLGHALLEHLLLRRPERIRGYSVVIGTEDDSQEALDVQLAHWIENTDAFAQRSRWRSFPLERCTHSRSKPTSIESVSTIP